MLQTRVAIVRALNGDVRRQTEQSRESGGTVFAGVLLISHVGDGDVRGGRPHLPMLRPPLVMELAPAIG